MKLIGSLLIAAFGLLLVSDWIESSHHLQQDKSTQSFEWQKVKPESQGMSPKKLDAAKEGLAKRRTKSFLVIRNDRIVYEWYAAGHGPNRRHYTASLVKAIVAGLVLLLGLEDGRFEIDDPAWQYIPQWKDDPKKSKITLRHLATHSSGLSDAEHGRPGWEGAFWSRKPDPFTIARDKAPMLFQPGKGYEYSNPGIAMLSYAITASYRGVKNSDHRSLLKKRIMDPIGVPANEWSIGYGATYKVDGLNLVANWGGGSYTARAVARVGRLMLRKGNWQGKQLIDSKLVKKAVSYAGMPLPPRPKGNPQPASGLCWWINHDGVWPKVPRDAFGGAGAGNQMLLVIPSMQMIIVRMGGTLGKSSKGEGFWGGAEKYLFNPVVRAVIDKKRSGKAKRSASSSNSGKRRSKAPYPLSPVIDSLTWAPKDKIIRKAKGSDNWPMTWADDDLLYTAYGDGNGFVPRTPQKLGLGIAKIIGHPPDFKGSNIRAPSIETYKFGGNGPKGSGMLMLDGVLYMLIRNVGNSQLVWSTDYGKTWKRSDWKFSTSFGHPTFLNFGKNYAGARDDYVYVYSHDSNSAYQPADRMVLARVPRKKIRERSAYEFFRGVDNQGRPQWTKDVDRRGAVFEHSKRCYRSGITYNAELKRYLWCQVIKNGRDSRFQGGIGIYDAPEPWGPWTTVYFNEKWDVGPGETASFPTKWMSPDGKTLHLVFSGDDCFSVRRATLTCKQKTCWQPTPGSCSTIQN